MSLPITRLGRMAIILLLGGLVFSAGVSMAGVSYYGAGDIVIAPVYLGAAPFSEGLAAVADGSGVYHITPEGKRAFPGLVFEEAGSFSEGLAVVKVGGKTGYIDKQGKMAIKPQFEDGYGFKNGRALVWTERGGPWAFIDATGKAAATLGGVSFPGHKPEFSEGLAVFYVYADGHHLYGYMDEKGARVIPARYKAATPFSGGLAAVQLNLRELDDWTYIDRGGNRVMQRRFYGAQPFIDGLAQISTGVGSHELIDAKGETVLKLPYPSVSYAGANTEIHVCKEQLRCGLMDLSGNWVLEPVYDNISPFSDEGLAVFSIIHAEPVEYTLRPGMNIRKLGTGVINCKGELVIEPGAYKSIEPFVNGLARVEDGFDGRARYINARGELVEDFLLPLGKASGGLQLVWNKDGRYGFVRAQ